MLVAVSAAFLATAVTATPSCPAAAARAAQARYEAIDYQGAIVAVSDLDRCTDGTPEELADALRWRAQAFAAGGKTEEAIDGFALVDIVSPSYRLGPEVSPKVHELFEAGRQRARTRGLVFARIRRAVREAGGASIDVEIFDPLHVATDVRAVLDSTGEELRAKPLSGRMWSAAMPFNATGTVSVIVLGPTGARYRSGAVPIVSLVPKEDAAPPPVVNSPVADVGGLSKKQWIIVGVIVGAVIIAGGIASGVAIKNANQPEMGTLGRIEIP